MKERFGAFYLDKEKDIVITLFREREEMSYVLRTPNHNSGNLITNLARVCHLPVTFDDNGFKIIEGEVPSYVDGSNHELFILRLGNTKIANIYPDGTIDVRASIPAIAKTLMSQTKDYPLDEQKTIVKTFILSRCKFRADLHTHMNANLHPDILIALGIAHQIRYPLYYIKKLELKCTQAQTDALMQKRAEVEKAFHDSPLTGKYLTRKIDDNTFINFADFILNNIENAAFNIARIRASLTILKDGQAVFTNLEKVYLYRYVFTKGVPSAEPVALTEEIVRDAGLPDKDIEAALLRMLSDRRTDAYRDNTIFQDKLLWIARAAAAQGIRYMEISDTTLVKRDGAARMLAEVHRVMPSVTAETGVTLRFLAAIRRIALTIVKDNVVSGDYFRENLQVLDAVASDPYVAGADIIGEEINDIRELAPVLKEIVRIAARDKDFVIRVHAGENDSLRDNVANSIACVRDALAEGQTLPHIRIGHGLYTADLRSLKGKALIRDLKESGAVLEFQITSNVRLNNLTSLDHHPLRYYLKNGVRCVQGTDGGALYGTDSIDEQLSLEKLLSLTPEELTRMRQCEEAVIRFGMRGMARKTHALQQLAVSDIEAYYQEQIDALQTESDVSFIDADKLVSEEVFERRIEEMPVTGMPVVLIGGSFNTDRRATVVRESGTRLIDEVLKSADPEKVFFVIGHRITGYERYLIERNKAVYGGAFKIYAVVPTLVTRQEERRLKKSGVKIRLSIEPTAMGSYKSLAYEVFKRRPSILIALDGNSTGANVIQEAKNAKHPCRIYVSAASRILRMKAASIEGYVTTFSDPDQILPRLRQDLNRG